MRGLYALKPWYTARLSAAVALASRRRLSPDLFTALGVAGAGAAAVAIAAGWWPAAGILLAGRLAGANLDGAVARARGVSSPWGFVLNEIGDRAGDALMFAGLVGLAVTHEPRPSTVGVGSVHVSALVLVLVAAGAATLPTFASLASAAAGGPRLNGGPVGKTERCALAVLAAGLPAYLGVVALVLGLGSVATTVHRLRVAHRELAAPDRVPAAVAR